MELISQMRRQRRSMVQYKEQLKFCYDAILYYGQDLLRRRKCFNTFAAVTTAYDFMCSNVSVLCERVLLVGALP